MLTLEQAIEIAKQAHEGQYRKPKTVVTDSWDCYKTKGPIIHENGNKIHWVIKDTFLVYEPYITHSLAVMNMMDTEEEKIVAVLHDVFEDTEFRLNYVRTSNEEDTKHWISDKEQIYYITHSMYDALFLLTKTSKMSYIEYIDSTTLSKLATKVKLADIFHNMSCEPSEHAKQKYLKALPILLKGI